MKHILVTLIALSSIPCFAQITPEISSWILNTNGSTDYNNIPSNVQQVQYSPNNVYISATCIPGYDIGPWTGNPNTPANQNFVFKLTRNPVENTGSGSGHNIINESVTTYSGTTGITKPESNIAFDVFPNPTHQFFSLTVENDAPNDMQVEVLNSVGQLRRIIKNIQPSVPYTFDMSGYPKGIYFVRLNSSRTSITKPIILN